MTRQHLSESDSYNVGDHVFLKNPGPADGWGMGIVQSAQQGTAWVYWPERGYRWRHPLGELLPIRGSGT